MYVHSINYFRAIAIVFIVASHTFAVAEFSYESTIGISVFNLTAGGTSFFVFISGFLFHHIFYKKFNYKKFLSKKFKYVFIPFVTLSTIRVGYLFYQLYIEHNPELNAIPYGEIYLTGSAFVGYWYIPFIMLIFILSPIFINFIKLKLNTQIFIIIFFITIAAFIHRATYLTNFAVFQEVLYFIPVYLIGILSSLKKEFIYTFFKQKSLYFLIPALVLALYQASIGEAGNYTKNAFVYQGIDLMIFQKVLLCLFFMIWLNRFENTKLKLLNFIAENSFGIYFLHGILISLFVLIKKKLDFSFQENSLLIYVVITASIFSLSLLLTLAVKYVFPKISRQLVGS